MNGGASARPASKLAAAATPASAATCQCSIRISSSPPSCRQCQRATSPAATMPSAAKRRSSHTTPLSTVSPESASHSVAGTTPMPTTTTSAANVSPVSSSTTSLPAVRRRIRPARRDAADAHTGSQVHPVRPVQRGAVRADRWSRGLAQRDRRSASSTVTRQPRSAHVDATSAPMKPAPITTTRRRSTAVTAARSANESSSVRRVNRPSALRSVPRSPATAGAARRWR